MECILETGDWVFDHKEQYKAFLNELITTIGADAAQVLEVAWFIDGKLTAEGTATLALAITEVENEIAIDTRAYRMRVRIVKNDTLGRVKINMLQTEFTRLKRYGNFI